MKKIIILLIAGLMIISCKDNKTGNKTADILDYTGKNAEDYFTGTDYNLVILNYWTTYCSPCQKEMVDLDKLYQKYKDNNILIIGVCDDGAEQVTLMHDICNSLGVNYPIIYGTAAGFSNEAINGYPTTFIIKKDNSYDKITGKRPYKFFEEKIKESLD